MTEDKKTDTINKVYDPDKDPEAQSGTDQFPRVGVERKKGKIFKWCISIFCLIFLVVFGILSLINYSYKKEIIKNSKELAVEIEQFVKEKYGDLSVKQNGWAYAARLSKMSSVPYEVFVAEEYKALSHLEKKNKLTDLGIFIFCEELKSIKDYDVIVPEWFHPFDINDFGQSVSIDSTLKLIKRGNILSLLMVCADWYFENSEQEKGFECLELGFRYVKMLPAALLSEYMIKINCSMALLGNVSKHFEKFSNSKLEDLEKEIAEACLLKPFDYYSSWLFEAYYMCAIMVDEDILKAMEKYRGGWYDRFISWFAGNLLCSNRLMADHILYLRKSYSIFKKNISEGNYIKGHEEFQRLISKLKEKPSSHVISVVGLPSTVKIINSYFENDANALLMLLSIKAKLYKHKNGIFPSLFNEFVKENEYKHLKLSKDGRIIEFRGYRIGFIKNMSNGSEYTSNENRKDHFALYAIPLSYGNTGMSVFISNETSLIYSKDIESASSIIAWPADLEKNGWENMQ